MDVKSIADYEEFTGRKWPFSEKAFESLKEYYEADDRYLKCWDGSDPMRCWKEYNNPQEFVDAVIAPLVGKNGPMGEYITLAIPEEGPAKWEFLERCKEFYEEHECGVVIEFDYGTKFLVL